MDPLFFSLAGNIVAVVAVAVLSLRLIDARQDRLENPKLVAENLKLIAERDRAKGLYRELQRAVIENAARKPVIAGGSMMTRKRVNPA